tara:strand:- start:1083 stop:1307 length:225 start_codon:yes stop_codon:yes gene_type:complete
MVKIGWIGLQLNTSLRGNQSVGKQPSMNEYARVTINASGLGTSVMNEGQVLLLTMGFVILITLIMNIIAYGITG